MKIPKLKAWYTALSAQEYQEFVATRRIEVTANVTFDIVTGTMVNTGRGFVILTAGAARADLEYRARSGSLDPVYVLRVPVDCVDRNKLEQIQANYYCYRATLHIPHCGVELFEPQEQELLPEVTAAPKFQVLAASHKLPS